ncbi:tudor domain protein [Trichuris suis]|nr:tudor domain protein [Trichuris suis]
MERDNLQSDLHSVLITFKNGATGHDFVKAYQDCLGRPLDLAKLGYKNVDALMASFPNLVERYKSSSGVVVYKAKTHAATKALENLIANQKDSSKNKNKFGVLRPLESRPVLQNAPARTPTMSPAPKVCRPAIKPLIDVRAQAIKPLIDVRASFPNPYPTNNGSISAREKAGAPVIKQSASTSYLVANRGATSANLVPTYQKPDAKTNVPPVQRQALLWNTTAFPGDVAPAYWTCPGRYRWKAPVAIATVAERQPQQSCAAAAAVDENGPYKKISNQPRQSDKTAPLSNSSSINRTTNLSVSEAVSCVCPLDERTTFAVLQQATKTLLTAEQKRVEYAAEGKAERCQKSGPTSSISQESEKNGFVTCDAGNGRVTQCVISEEHMNNVVNGNFSSGDEDGNGVSRRSLSALSNYEDAVNPCVGVEEPDLENSIKIEVVKFLDANLVTFVRTDSESTSQFKTLFNEMRFAYGGHTSKPLESPKIGEHIAVKCEKHWLRAIVCAVFDFDSALVFYSDVGELQRVQFSKLYPLFPRFSEVPQMAFVGKLLGVPSNLWNGSIESLNDWFEKMTRNNELVAVASDHNWSLRVGVEPVNLYLHMKQSGINVNLNSMVKDKCMEMVGSTTITFSLLKRIGKALEDDFK